MKKSLFTILFLSTLTIYGQTLKTYTGPYEGGEATYQYYEKDYERIFNGSFAYKSKNDNPAVNTYGSVFEDVTITGFFKDNFKNGQWESKQVLTSQVGNIKYKNASKTTIVKGLFTNGLKNGEWSYEIKSVLDDKKESYIQKYTFKDNLLVGTFDFDKLKGSIDNNGNYIGSWSAIIDGKDYIAEFQNNVFTKLIVRNASDGTVYLKYLAPELLNFDSNDAITIENTTYKIISCKVLSERSDVVIFKDPNKIESESTEYFTRFHEFIENAVSAFDNSLDEINHGSKPIIIPCPNVISIHELTEAEKEKLELNSKRNEGKIKAESLFNEKKFKESLKTYQDIVWNYGGTVEIEKRIKEIKEIVKQEELKAKKDEEEKQWNEAIANGDNAFTRERFEEAMSFYKKAEFIKTDASLNEKIDKTQVILDQLETIKRRDREIERLTSKTSVEHQNIQRNYVLIDKKPKLTKIYLAFYDDIQIKILGCTLDEKLVNLKKLDKFQSNLINLVTYQNTDEFEKEAKKIKDSNEIWNILVSSIPKVDWNIK